METYDRVRAGVSVGFDNLPVEPAGGRESGWSMDRAAAETMTTSQSDDDNKKTV
jgi:hypothetical protein